MVTGLRSDMTCMLISSISGSPPLSADGDDEKSLSTEEGRAEEASSTSSGGVMTPRGGMERLMSGSCTEQDGKVLGPLPLMQCKDGRASASRPRR